MDKLIAMDQFSQTGRQFLDLVSNIKVGYRNGKPKPHKPLLLLCALQRQMDTQEDRYSYEDLEMQMRTALQSTGALPRGRPRCEYPYWRLQQDGVWEVQPRYGITANSAGDVGRRHLLSTTGGFPAQYVRALRSEPDLILAVVQFLLERYFEPDQHHAVLQAVGITRTLRTVKGPVTVGQPRAFLYTWNPRLWNWSDLPEAIRAVCSGESYIAEWSCGPVRKQVGDHFMLMRLGADPKGIVGCGVIVSRPHEGTHWDRKKAATGTVVKRTDLLFKALSRDVLISLNDLNKRFPKYRWTPQQGGLSIPWSIASQILQELGERGWGELQTMPQESAMRITEGAPRQITVTTYDRSTKARQVCIEYHKAACAACGFEYSSKYKELGTGYIEVHHLKPIADKGGEYELDPVADLRPVCANCHRMLHMKRPPLSIEELIQIIRRE